jgi:hypothetical protein
MVAGDAQVRLRGQTTPEKATANQQLPQGSELQVATGIAEIDFENLGTGFIGGDSAIDMTQLSAGATGRISRLTLDRGVARFYVNTHGTDTFSISANGLTVAPQQQLADFRVEIGTEATTVRVLGGEVIISNNGPNTTVRKGQTFTLPQGAQEGKVTETSPLESFSGYAPIWLLPPPTTLPHPITPPFKAIIPPAAPAPQVPTQQLPGPVSPSDAAHAGAPTPIHPPYPEQPPAYPEIPPKYP